MGLIQKYKADGKFNCSAEILTVDALIVT